MPVNFGNWEVIDELGEGGQSKVYLVREKHRQDERSSSIREIAEFRNYPKSDDARAQKFAEAIANYVRSDDISELGALKVFKIPQVGFNPTPAPGSEEHEAFQRMNTEIGALRANIAGLPRLLDSNENERWIVTEYFPEKTLEQQHTRYKGNVLSALKAFRSLVKTVDSIHKLGMVHRDIKPANVFVRNEDELVLGDFGIVYVPGGVDRVTVTNERVGPRDYMPPWANLGRRHEQVRPNIDIFMLGKLLWSMLDGRLLLPYTYFRSPQYDFNLAVTFPDDPHMHLINKILDKCVVEHESDCTIATEELLSMVDAMIGKIKRGGQILSRDTPRPCRVCGMGHYQREGYAHTQPPIPRDKPVGLTFSFGTSEIATVPVYPHVCDKCGHVELFTKPTPQS
jgi:serine/threonine protein kinase